MQRDIEHLVALGTRESTTREYVMAAQWTASQLRDCGFTVELKEIAVGSARSYNVVAVRHGSGPTPRVRMLATAHLDSIGDRQGRPAPGADDNATGVAGVLELARCLADRDLPYDLELVLFGGEEQGLVGSKAYVKELPTPPRIRGVVNMDMIGSNIETPGHTLMIQSVELFEWLIDALVTAAHTYTTLTLQVSTSHPRLNSDHLPFIRKFIPAVLLIEGNGKANPRMHSQRDTPAHLDYDLILQILRAHLAFLVTACGAGD
jgi:Zn-dependent M28 family amino/carboxypeptidase